MGHTVCHVKVIAEAGEHNDILLDMFILSHSKHSHPIWGKKDQKLTVTRNDRRTKCVLLQKFPQNMVRMLPQNSLNLNLSLLIKIFVGWDVVGW